ncbi:autotransporter outer membrane beta-barrel domain-containing protein [Microbulbifer yueqingensis]|uniref:Outer membrane autotransporter barrel domain-containing protein n=1 Tax=Microbulbifer yueqingensis TaxID=658219 RepID=A0A1G8XSR1_9GAMM|nr:autotransporter outer membrane beta-barrel domain-containing protein [Microbulbifer yueqingensis]SDJ93486.1 outer membrane autotransporter barrel domain-containing protein [Microbulbifer yueqingensis]
MSEESIQETAITRSHRLIGTSLVALGLLSAGSTGWAACSPGNIGTPGNDVITCDADNDAEGADVESLGGNDTLDLLGGTINNVDAGEGDDQVNILGAIVEGNLATGNGADTIILNSRDSDVGSFFGDAGIDAGAGNDTIEILDGLAFRVRGGEGNDEILLDGGFVYEYIDGGPGDDIIHWDEGLAAEVRGGTGSDFLRIDSFAYEGDAILDGGDDFSADDGDIDTLIFILDYTVDGGLLRNWERIGVWGSSKMIFTGALEVGGGFDADGNHLGLDIFWGGLVEFDPAEFTLTGNIANAGTVNLQNDRFDVLSVVRNSSGEYGNYIGRNGRLWLEAKLNTDTSQTDLVRISGATSGHTTLRVRNLGGLGALTTGDGIRIVEVGGNSPEDALVLDGDYISRDGYQAVIAGAYGYTLHHNALTDPDDGNWYLRSSLPVPPGSPPDARPRWQPGATIYESYAQVLRSLNHTDSLRQRLGNRFWMGSSYKDLAICDYVQSQERTIDGGGPWIRAEARHTDEVPGFSTTASQWEQDRWRVQLGIDAPLGYTIYGRSPIAGVALHYGEADTDVQSFFGRGEIETEYFGATGTLTWYGTDGTYSDAQVYLNWFDSDFRARGLRTLPEGREAFGYGVSFEAGRSIKLCDSYSVTPQLQLNYSNEDAEDFRDVYDVKVAGADNGGLRVRLGAAFEERVTRRKSGEDMFGTRELERYSLYITPSIVYNIGDETSVTVSETVLEQEPDDWFGTLSMGATYDECGDYCSIYGELNLSTSLEHFGDSVGAAVMVGLRLKW